MGHPSAKTSFYQGQEVLHSQAIHVPDGASHSNRGMVRSPSYETHTVAPEATLTRTGESGEGHPIAHSLQPHLDWWLNESNVLRGQPLHPLQHALMFTDTSNEGWGAHLGDSTTRGVWSVPESRLHINLLGVKSSFPGPQEFRASLQGLF